jgi:hypothetical protein
MSARFYIAYVYYRSAEWYSICVGNVSDNFWAIIWLSDVDIGCPIESDRWTASDKLYITQLLTTRYSINVTNTFGGYQYNKQWMYVYAEDFQLNIHLMYTGIRWIADWIFIWCINGSGRLLTEYLFSVCRTPPDYWLYIHSVYAGVRQITDQIFIQRMA